MLTTPDPTPSVTRTQSTSARHANIYGSATYPLRASTTHDPYLQPLCGMPVMETLALCRSNLLSPVPRATIATVCASPDSRGPGQSSICYRYHKRRRPNFTFHNLPFDLSSYPATLPSFSDLSDFHSDTRTPTAPAVPIYQRANSNSKSGLPSIAIIPRPSVRVQGIPYTPTDTYQTSSLCLPYPQ